MSGETRSVAVPVSADWALWGKERRDLEYRLLRCSDGALNAANFDELLTRYSPGTLEDLPQVTVSWLSDGEQRDSYIAMAIHEEPEDHRLDATGRRVVLTRCFCVPYTSLAEGLVSYQAMYDVFRNEPLGDRRGTIKTSLPVIEPGRRTDASAMRAAALLLTCKPVCILGAERVSLAERLRFIDSVMSLLPYGLRSQLSASTWASSHFWEHKFRLFFSGALRPVDECQVIWGDEDITVAPEVAEDYLSWLRNDAPDLVPQLARRAGQLAAIKAPVRFRNAEIGQLLAEVYERPSGPWPPTEPRPLPSGPPTGEHGERSIEELLIECDNRMRANAPVFIGPAIRRLAEHRDDKTTAGQRHWYRQVIKDHELFREDKQLSKSQQATLYEALLGIAFETPLDYQGYCLLEDCAGQPLPRSLLRAVKATGMGGFYTELLVCKGIGELKSILAALDGPAALMRAVADPGLRPEHGRLIYEITFDDLINRAGANRLDEQLLRSSLAEHAYLAPALQRIYPEPETRLDALGKLLRLTYDHELDRSEIRAILRTDGGMPTGDLLFAVVAMADPADAEFAERTFTRVLARNYRANTRNRLLPRFPDHDEVGGDRQHQLEAAPVGGLRGRTQQLVLRGSGRGQRGQASPALRQLPRVQVPSGRRGGGQAPWARGDDPRVFLARRVFAGAALLVALFIILAFMHVIGILR